MNRLNYRKCVYTFYSAFNVHSVLMNILINCYCNILHVSTLKKYINRVTHRSKFYYLFFWGNVLAI